MVSITTALLPLTLHRALSDDPAVVHVLVAAVVAVVGAIAGPRDWHAAARVGNTQVGEGAAVEGAARLALELLLPASVIAESAHLLAVEVEVVLVGGVGSAEVLVSAPAPPIGIWAIATAFCRLSVRYYIRLLRRSSPH